MIRHPLQLLCLISTLSAQPNVLFLAVDDLRPELASFGANHIHAPAIDAIASTGRAFHRHYVQAPTCGASRHALLTGHYARTPERRTNNAIFHYAANHSKEPPSLPELFRKNGYRTVSLGKISHHPGGLGGNQWNQPNHPELPHAWDVHEMPCPPWQNPSAAMHAYANGKARKLGTTPAFEHVPGNDKTYTDGWIADAAIHELNNLAIRDQPFFLAVGLMKPHLPFACPKTYRDRYTNTNFPAISNPNKPKGISTWHASAELMQYNHGGRDPRTDTAYADELRRSYAACITYIDTQIAKIMARLDTLNLTEKTIVVLWSDHGYHLGEHAVWGKHTLFEESLRAPLIIRVPGMSAAGSASKAIVETVDIYPTLSALCKIPLSENMDGRSLMLMLDNPNHKGDDSASSGAISYSPNQETIRTASHRLIRHRDAKTQTAYELYDHRTHPSETQNIADQQPEIVIELSAEIDRRLR
jgi:iduronate 2-sulfatase